MRNLNLDEIIDKIKDYSNDLVYIDVTYLDSKFILFWNFLNQQPISSSILSKIEEDHLELFQKIFDFKPLDFRKHVKKIKDILITSEIQGAFAYFILKDELSKDSRTFNSMLSLTMRWYGPKPNSKDTHNDFNEYIFKPFYELITWYLYENKSANSNDYFSKKEVDEISDKLDNLLNDIRLGQEVLFEEIQDLKEQLKNLKKKNWGELLKGKLFDLTISKVISIDTFTLIFKTITGNDLKFLN